MCPIKRDELIKVYRNGLLEDTLPFWLPRSIDEKCGGFIVSRDRDGSILDTDKGMWQQARFTWLLATLCNAVEPCDEWVKAARHGIEFISNHGFDDDGRMWFHVTREGEPIRKRRYVFTETFGAIAYAACAKAFSDETMERKARELYTLARNHFTTPDLTDSKYTSTRPVKSMGPLMISLATAQEMRSCLKDESFTKDIDMFIQEIQEDFMKPDIKCVMESVGPDGAIIDHFDGRLLNPGHAIECAWFVLNEARYRGNDPTLIKMGCQMLDWMWARGWDKEFGGMFYFRDVYAKPIQEYWHDMKFWWVHNEVILATLLAYLLTGESRYEEMHSKAQEWAYTHFPDHVHGEWFGYLHRDGRVSVPLKGNLWKGPFHLPRMQLLAWKWLEAKG